MANEQPQEMGREERIGFHKGALTTLSKEHQELLRLVGITTELIKMHLQNLKDMGIDLEAEAKATAAAAKKPLDDRIA